MATAQCSLVKGVIWRVPDTLYGELQDHKACDAEEQARVEALGGFVIRRRVMGVLAVARAFGDFLLKKYVPAQPYTSTTKLDARSQFIILACDGIWDVLEDQVRRACAAVWACGLAAGVVGVVAGGVHARHSRCCPARAAGGAAAAMPSHFLLLPSAAACLSGDHRSRSSRC